MTEHDSGLTDEEIAAAERLAEACAGESAGKIAELLLESTGQERDDTNAAPRWPPDGTDDAISVQCEPCGWAFYVTAEPEPVARTAAARTFRPGTPSRSDRSEPMGYSSSMRSARISSPSRRIRSGSSTSTRRSRPTRSGPRRSRKATGPRWPSRRARRSRSSRRRRRAARLSSRPLQSLACTG